MNKKSLAILLSKLSSFESPDVRLEQYSTPSEIAAEILWFLSIENELKDKVIADLGCGPGIFGLGSSLLGAKKVYLVDKDKNAIEIAKNNKKLLEKEIRDKLNCAFNIKDINDFNQKVDLVIQNPPFGTKEKHSDKIFLQKAFSLSNLAYSLHKIESSSFLSKFSQDSGFNSKLIMQFDFPLTKTLAFHKKKTYPVKVGLWRFEKT